MYDMVSHCNRFANAAGPGRGVGVDPKAPELASGPKRVAERGAPPTQNASDLGDLGWRIKYLFLYEGRPRISRAFCSRLARAPSVLSRASRAFCPRLARAPSGLPRASQLAELIRRSCIRARPMAHFERGPSKLSFLDAQASFNHGQNFAWK